MKRYTLLLKTRKFNGMELHIDEVTNLMFKDVVPSLVIAIVILVFCNTWDCAPTILQYVHGNKERC